VWEITRARPSTRWTECAGKFSRDNALGAPLQRPWSAHLPGDRLAWGAAPAFWATIPAYHMNEWAFSSLNPGAHRACGCGQALRKPRKVCALNAFYPHAGAAGNDEFFG
jgi:hypothetical protein